jgi:Ni/Fe-hydrogenase subunit HybB-like protein
MVIRGTFVHLMSFDLQSTVFVLEIVVGLITPMLALLSVKVRNSPRLLAGAALLVMLGIVLNRAAVYWIGYKPATPATFYTPSLAEWGFTIGAAACVAFAWRTLAILFPIVSLAPAAGSVRRAVATANSRFDGRKAKSVASDYLSPVAPAAIKG